MSNQATTDNYLSRRDQLFYVFSDNGKLYDTGTLRHGNFPNRHLSSSYLSLSLSLFLSHCVSPSSFLPSPHIVPCHPPFLVPFFVLVCYSIELHSRCSLAASLLPIAITLARDFVCRLSFFCPAITRSINAYICVAGSTIPIAKHPAGFGRVPIPMAEAHISLCTCFLLVIRDYYIILTL